MDNIDIPATIAAVGTLVTAVGTILIAFWAYRAKTHAARAAELAASNKGDIAVVQGEVREVGSRIDGRLTALLKSSSDLARAEGVAQGEQSERDRSAPPKP